MAKIIDPVDVGKPKTLTLRLDNKVAAALDRLIAEAPEVTYSSLIARLITERAALDAKLTAANELATSRSRELRSLKQQIIQLKQSLSYLLGELPFVVIENSDQ